MCEVLDRVEQRGFAAGQTIGKATGRAEGRAEGRGSGTGNPEEKPECDRNHGSNPYSGIRRYWRIYVL